VEGVFVADACALIAYLSDAPLSTAADAAIQAPAFVSSITVWEMTHKARAGKLPVYWGTAGLARFLNEEGFEPLPLSWDDAERATALPPIHKDPMDRLLIAQALRIGATIVTSDRLFEAYGVKTIW
jgi:PIN domain nuclease of toxin-antitoxin system